MSPSHANKKGVRYRYYVSQVLLVPRNRRLLAKVVAGGPEERLDFAPHESNVVCDGALD
jgi:hypothetical protein